MTCICAIGTDRIASGSLVTIRIWSLDGNLVTTVVVVDPIAMREVTTVCAIGGIRIASGSKDNTVRIWTFDGTHVATCGGQGQRGHETSDVCVRDRHDSHRERVQRQYCTHMDKS